MLNDIPEFSAARILVVGDVMLDRYWHGDTGRISPEAPVPVVRVTGEDLRPGGAANVALNIAVLGGRVTLLGVVGEDEAGELLQEKLEQRGVHCVFHRQARVPTATKLRVVSRHQQLIRIDFEEPFPSECSRRLQVTCAQQLPQADLLIVSDYDKGAIGDCSGLIAQARALGIPVLIDPKRSDYSAFRGATLLTPNQAEFESAVGYCADEHVLVKRGMQVIAEQALDGLLITRGELGMILLLAGEEPRHMRTRAREVFDVTGAGDTVIAVLGAAMVAGLELPQAAHLANVSAGLVVGRFGTATVSRGELQDALLAQRVEHRGLVDEETLVCLREEARQRGETWVMTNGVFDILHAGHVTYLEQAARLGDRLVVAVNVDETVTALKGAGRPVNCLHHRMTMLAALSCVDWVVAFSEQTPERLICRLAPDFLVKGGDNDPERIPGAECTRKQGGKVAVMDYVEGISTSNIIRDIQAR
jgi:D-beta-D-heptose 7-phosphate kinase/D-beta-D-heptose 1-phosphate adenosyltransferase